MSIESWSKGQADEPGLHLLIAVITSLYDGGRVTCYWVGGGSDGIQLGGMNDLDLTIQNTVSTKYE